MKRDNSNEDRQTSSISASICVLRYMSCSLAPFQGRFFVDGEDFEKPKGDWTGDLIIIEFRDRQRAQAWLLLR